MQDVSTEHKTPGDYRAGRKTNRSRRNGRIQGQKHRSVQRPSQLLELETNTHTHTKLSEWEIQGVDKLTGTAHHKRHAAVK